MLIARTLGAICFAATLCAALDGFSQESLPQTPQVETQEQTKSRLEAEQPNDQKTDRGQQSPFGVEQIGSKGAQGEGHSDTAEGDQQGSEFWPALYGYRLKVTDTLLVAFTFLLFWATLALWLSTRRLVSGAEITAKRQLRAYVDLMSGQVIDFGIPNRPFRVRIVVKNSGQTPAYEVDQWVSVGPDDIPPKIGFPPPSPEIPSIKSTLAPGAVSTTLQECEPLSAMQIEKIRSGKAAIWAWGEIAYKDAFGEDRKSWFRLIYRGGDHTRPRGGMSVDRDGNGAD
jgi:hypothetical protein